MTRMTDSKRPVAPHTPDWQVIGVVSDGDGLPEFSYTVGLHERGLPELFFWDSPSDGDDPGGDWSLRHLERGHLLNRWAGNLIEGRLQPGTTWTELMDFGLATVTFTCGELVAPLTVEALLAHPQARVMPIRYALRRDALREPGNVDVQAETEIRQWTAEVVHAHQARGRGTRLPVPPYDTSHRQQFGPATPLVTALRAVVGDAEPNELTHLLMLSVTLDMRGLLRAELALGGARAFARAVGLHKAVDAADRTAAADVRRLIRKPPIRRELAGWSASQGPSVAALGRALTNAVGAAYTAAAVIDVVPADLRTAALAPVLTALTDGTMPRFWCSPEVSDPARRALANLPLGKIVAIRRAWELLMEHTADVHVVALTGSGDVPPGGVLLVGTPTLRRIQEATRGDPESEAGALDSLREVARAYVVGDLPEAAAVLKLLNG